MRSSKEKAQDKMLADRLARKAAQYFKREMKSWRNEPGFRGSEMRQMIQGDRRELIHLSALVRKGEYIEALRVLQAMDTAVAEEVPVTVYDQIQKWG